MVVDIPALADLGARLRHLQREFDRLGHKVEDYATVFGSHEIEQALGDFARNWSDSRHEIDELLGHLAQAAEAAAEAYAATEAEISAALGGGS